MTMHGRQYRKKYHTEPNGDVFMFTIVDRVHRGRNGEMTTAKLYRSVDDGVTWLEVPLHLNWRSLIYGKTVTSWPPESIDSVAIKEGKLTFIFHDREDEYERLPFGCGDESLWEATKNKNGTWTLRRLRKLDYDGVDRCLKWGELE